MNDSKPFITLLMTNSDAHAKCGCKIEWVQEGKEDGVVQAHLCPMHAAAKKLLYELRSVNYSLLFALEVARTGKVLSEREMEDINQRCAAAKATMDEASATKAL